MGISVVLIEPKIPQNTGNIGRLCAATDSSLHLVEPLGFDLSHDGLARSGMDYWDHLDLWVHPSWREFRSSISRDRCLYFSSNGKRSYLDAPYRSNSVLLFGNETDGMPERICEKHPDQLFRIPMRPAIRSLNLATAAGVVIYECLRQTDGQSDMA